MPQDLPAFLKRNGHQIQTLVLPHVEYEASVLLACPSLQVLRVEGIFACVPKTVQPSSWSLLKLRSPHRCLRRVEVRSGLMPGRLKSDLLTLIFIDIQTLFRDNDTWGDFVDGTSWDMLPALRELALHDARWPTNQLSFTSYVFLCHESHRRL